MTTPGRGRAACARCGTEVPPGARHCVNCGADVSGQQGQVATAYVAPAETARLAPDASGAAQLDALRRATLGEYDVHSELGQGGMATVYLAHDIALDRKVAIKVMSPALLATAGMVERFKREARTAAALSHPHIIPIYAVRENASLVYFVMKFVEGRSLESILRAAGPLPLPLVRAVLYQVGAALGYAHRRGVVHRDVKPANIMLDTDGWVMVTDFGIAKVSETQGLTMTGATIGTPAYMSPEQCAAKRELSGASDQYSLGIVAYEMLAGQPPFVADTNVGLLYAQVHEPPVPVTERRPDCPPETAAALMRMLEKDPALRWPDVEAAVAALGGAPLTREDPIRTQLAALGQAQADADVRRLATPVSPVPLPRNRKSKPKRRGIPTVAWVTPLVAIVAVGAWWAARRGPAIPPAPPPSAPSAPTAPAAPAPPLPPTRTEPFLRRGAAPLRERLRDRRERRAIARAEAGGETAPAPTAPPAPPAGPRAAIEETVAALGRALESRNLARIRQVYPGMSMQQAQEWGDFFMGARNLRVDLHVTSLNDRGDEAEAGIEGAYTYDDMESGRGARRPISFRATLAREGTAWRLTSLR
ncbi:MAG TPA: serine/threonine-protein kinase [Gemmatimonadales bacterium]|nr:serine/threonine-protein kinase [Gemmatimonadales bacterium]